MNTSGSHELAFHKILIEEVSHEKDSNFEAYVYGN